MISFRIRLSATFVAAVLFGLAIPSASGLPASAVGFIDPSQDNSRPVIRADADGNLMGDLLDERGELLVNPRIVLEQNEKRQNPGFNYGSTKVRGVNLGGWLVAEPWITPSLFDNTGDSRVIDEWTFGQYVGDAYSRLESHWASFITEDDFRQIASAGLNHVRIPIGYWAFDTSNGEPYVRSNQFNYLIKAVRWARNHNIKVLIDLHGAPGSQNGFDNSGRKGAIRWPNNPNNANRAKAALQTMAKTFSASEFYGTVTVIELLNEPAGFNGNALLEYTKQFYRDGYGAVRQSFGNVAVAIHDAFQDLSYWNGFMPPPQYQQVLLDTHIYSVFSPGENAMSKDQRLNFFCSKASSISSSQNNLWTIVGEWTTAPTDCAKYLNGRGVGARYDGSFGGDSYYIGSCSAKTGNGNNFSQTYKNYLRDMFETQISVYERGSGWIMWTWKTEQAADWDYKRGLAGGWITYNLNSRPNARC
ncbi:glycoside hydrolase [Violaceomyces palustris]|uniref:Glycoside hydrolase n=1 Tax=Violaceomyces palustris TaxID=1673888 RepID=A0ACD0NPB3_9BASI|nr:glycoside hydrolase [Violaceomyces palustris]